mmetsp:Transcript_6811/g.17400  ORF Transcript_6811/g.17400 Transcript_6811/m.17400 type:complete len:271 (-) Transcript_6811:2070-2882(-)
MRAMGMPCQRNRLPHQHGVGMRAMGMPCQRNRHPQRVGTTAAGTRRASWWRIHAKPGRKEDVLGAIRGARRAEDLEVKRRADVMEKIVALEETQQQQAASPLWRDAVRKGLSGTWELLYQAPSKAAESLSEYDKRALTIEGPFLSRFKPLTRGLLRTTSNIQNISVDEGTIENIAEFKMANRISGRLVIYGTVDLPDVPPESTGTKAYVTFTRFVLDFPRLPNISISLGGKNPPKGWLRTTYLDDEVRIGRGDKGSVFVAKRIERSSGVR